MGQLVRGMEAFNSGKVITWVLFLGNALTILVSVCAFLFMTYLFFGEFYLFMQPIVKKSIDVDVGSGNQTVRINMNMIFPKVPCVCKHRLFL